MKRSIKNKKLSIIIGTLSSGGAERVVSVISEEFLKYFKSVEIITYYNVPIFYDINKSIKIICIEKETGTTNKLRNMFWLRNYMNRGTDIILSFLAPFNMFTIVAMIGIKIPILVADRNDPRKDPKNFILRKLRNFLYYFSRGVIVQTQNNLNYFPQKIRNKAVVIYNPNSIEKLKGKAVITPKKDKIVSVGRLIKIKNHKLLIDSFLEILKIYPNYKLIIYGEGEERKKLIEYIEKLNLLESIKLPGRFEDVHMRILDAKIFVLSSNHEGMPNALIEAMCLGLPCISTKVSGATELIKNNKNGILIDIGDKKECKDAMLNLIKNDNYRNRVAKNAVDIVSKIDKKMIIHQWVNFINDKT